MFNDADNFRFEVQPSPDDSSPAAFRVAGFDGEEEISRNYRFEIDLICEDPNVDLAKLIHRKATLTLSFNQTQKVHGIIGAIELGGNPSPGIYTYHAVLVPGMAKLALSEQSQIYGTNGEINVVDVVTTELTGSNARGTADASAARIDPAFIDFILPNINDYPKRDYIVQHQESDLDFVSRLLEHYGIFYFFDHSLEQEKLVLGDNNAVFGAVQSTGGSYGEAGGPAATLSFDQPTGRIPHGDTTVHELIRKRRPLPRTLILRDYNYRVPQGMGGKPMYLHAEAVVDPDGHGVVVGYGDHFRNHDEGQMLAKVRAQEMACTQETFTGTSDCYTFSTGHFFTLEDHFSDACNQKYLITKIRHQGGNRYRLDDPNSTAEEFAYRNEFTAIPAGTPYRPERRTPKPVVHGLMNAHVDAAGVGSRAEIDGEGRYKIRLPLDLAGSSDGMGSRYMRMTQPFSGGTSDSGNPSGFQFPLLKGTEVVCCCVNGDPDRPIIAGTVPNPKTRSPVSQENSTKNIIRTASGIRMEFDDGQPQGDKNKNSQSEINASLSKQQQQQGPREQEQEQKGVSDIGLVSEASSQSLLTNPVLSSEMELAQHQHQAQVSYTTTKTDEEFRTKGASWKLNVPNLSYIRRGKTDLTETEEGHYFNRDKDSSRGSGSDNRFCEAATGGGFDYIKGDRVEWTTGNKDVVIEGKNRMVIVKGGLNLWDATPLLYSHLWDAPLGWKSTVVEHARTESLTLTESKSAKLAASFDANVGIESTVSLGMSSSMRAGVDLNVFAGVTADIKGAASYSRVEGPSYDHSGSSSNTVNDFIELGVESIPGKVENKMTGATYGLYAAGLVAAGGLVAGMGLAIREIVAAQQTKAEEKDRRVLNAIGGSLEAARILTYGATIGTWAVIAKDIARLKGFTKKKATRIILHTSHIILENNSPTGDAPPASLTISDSSLSIQIGGVPVVSIDSSGLHVLQGKVICNTLNCADAAIGSLRTGGTDAGNPAVMGEVAALLAAAAAKAAADIAREKAATLATQATAAAAQP
ncbi:MAG: type VI secretion system VgrG family protein [Halioglobus sp.]